MHVCPRPLSQRDSAILLALDQYRRLDREHVADLFGLTRRKAQQTLEMLLWRGLIHRWPVVRYQGAPTPCTYALTSSGARHVARVRDQDPRPAVERARRAREHIFHLRHDLEANGFFVKLAAGARHLDDQGLYQWLGEPTCRVAHQRDGSPPSDGWGRYLLRDREITFDLEWDRGTEHARAIREKARGYVAYFQGRRDADLHHVLFVAPTRMREAELHDLVEPLLIPFTNLCRLWTTAVETAATVGWLGRTWLEIGGAPRRVAFADLPGQPRSARLIADCIGKERWWERRPGGGEGS
jgi:hypothetical protein